MDAQILSFVSFRLDVSPGLPARVLFLTISTSRDTSQVLAFLLRLHCHHRSQTYLIGSTFGHDGIAVMILELVSVLLKRQISTWMFLLGFEQTMLLITD